MCGAGRGPGRILIATVLFCGGTVPAQIQGPEQQSIFGRVDVTTPDPTEKGDWVGTWYFVSRDRKMALWIQGPEENPKVKFAFESTTGIPESFTTDWEGLAVYSSTGLPGKFALSLAERDRNHIAGSWDWWLGDENRGRHQTADFNLYRTTDGRTLVMLVTDSTIRRFTTRVESTTLDKQVWTFRKATRREARWAELPF
jgi:hypothetical protein